MSLSLITNWAVGLINGYKQQENGLPNSIKYGTMGLTSASCIFKILGEFDIHTINRLSLGSKLTGVCIVIPLLVGTNFCIGHHLGKAIRYADDDFKQDKNKIKLQLL
jgi:hypothetical protein